MENIGIPQSLQSHSGSQQTWQKVTNQNREKVDKLHGSICSENVAVMPWP